MINFKNLTDIELSQKMSPHLSEIAKNYIAPIYWHSGSDTSQSIIHNGTIFFLNTGERLFAVTANHVYQAFLNDQCIDPSIICKVGNLTFDLNERLIDCDHDIDIATFRIDATEVQKIGKTTLTSYQDFWPPMPPSQGKGVFFCGFPENCREGRTTKDCVFGIYAANTVATEISGDVITCEFDRDKWVAHPKAPFPDPGFNMSGVSGAPLLALIEMPILVWTLAGIIYQAPKNLGDMILVRRANRILANGFIQRFII